MLSDWLDLAQCTSLDWNKNTADEDMFIHLYHKIQSKYYYWNTTWILLLLLKKIPSRTKNN
jgi:hypothetical protein